MLPKWSQKGPTWSQQGPKWSQKGPTLIKRAPKGDQKTSKNRCPKKGRLQGRSGGKRALPGDVTNACWESFWRKMSPKGAIPGTTLNPKWLQNRTFEHRSALGPSKNALWERLLKKRENLMNHRCENQRFLMAQKHVWRYTLRL